jgi:hypothetical protein
MRKFKQFPPRNLRFRLLLILASVLTLLAAFASSAKADLIALWNFEDQTVDPPYPVNMTSSPLGFVQNVQLLTSWDPTNTSDVTPGLLQNLLPPDAPPSVHALGLSRSFANTANPPGGTFDMQLFSPAGFFQNMTLSFAINAQGNGVTGANIYYSTDGGGTFTLINAAVIPIPNSGTIVISQAIPALANNQNLLVLRIALLGGQSNGLDLQNEMDNIRVDGTIVPEPATVAGGLLGVLGLCWFQRRRLIRSVRFRRT